jgi:hypothetical protein
MTARLLDEVPATAHFPVRRSFPSLRAMRLTCLALLLVACSPMASARPHAADLRPWFQQDPGELGKASMSRAQRLRTYLPHIQPRMNVSQVMVLLGFPDGGYTRKGQWKWLDPREGILQYSAGSRLVRIYFDAQARVERIEENGVVIAKAPPSFFHRPLPRNVPWRRE